MTSEDVTMSHSESKVVTLLNEFDVVKFVAVLETGNLLESTIPDA